MNPEQSVLDAIDELVDESLAKPWHEISGYDNDIHQPDCPHELCSREWHGLPEGRCPGSAVYGPVKPPMKWACKVGEPQVSILDGDGNVTHIGHIRPDTRDDPAPVRAHGRPTRRRAGFHAGGARTVPNNRGVIPGRRRDGPALRGRTQPAHRGRTDPTATRTAPPIPPATHVGRARRRTQAAAMTRRIVNRGTRLRPPSRLRHDIRLAGGFDRWLNMMITMFGDLTSLAVTIAYNADYWTIPDDPFNPSAWTEVES